MTATDDRPAQTIPSTGRRGNTQPGPQQPQRQQAEQISGDTATQPPQALAALSPEELQRSVQELRAHQIELEMQNAELRRANAEIRAAQARDLDLYELALEAAQLGIYDWNLASNRILLSQQHERLWGLAPGVFDGTSEGFLSAVHPEDAPGILEEISRCTATLEPFSRDFRVLWPDGSVHWMHLLGKPIRDERGAPHRIIGTTQDITERRATDRALRESEQRFRETFMNAPLCILIHDADTGEVLDANPAAAAMYGFDSVAALKADQQRLWFALPPYSIDDARQWINKAVAEGPQRFEWQGRSVKGHVIWEFVYLRALVIEGKTRVLAMTVDISREKQSNLDLQASEARARAIIDASPVPMAIAYESGAVSYLNPAFVETFGYTLEEIPDWSDWRLKAFPDPEYREQVVNQRREALQRAARNGQVCEPVEIVVCCKDGRRRTMIARATPLETEPEVLYLNTAYDVTELQQARAAAEQAARVKSEFLTNMSHEIRTPLTAMLGLAQLLEGEALSAEQRHLVKQMRAAGDSLLALVNDILDLSRLTAGQLPLERRTFSPAVVLAQVMGLLGQQARAKGLDLRLDLPADLAEWLRGDRLRLERILINLVGNAVKFTERGEVCIQVSQQAIDTQVLRLRLQVQDTGIGIAPEHLASLGTAFNQVDGSITRRFGGTGLGLAISKQLVEQMDGSFGVDSTLGVGSTFWCELPFERASADDRPAQQAAPTERPLGARLRGVHCLVVDDSPLNQEVIERALRHEGARVMLVADGQQALDLLRAQPQDVDAVLMDIQMPVMDGLSATRAIRQELGLTELPVIAFSAGVLAEQRQQAQASGVSDFLAKPIDLDELVRVLHRWTKPQPAELPVAERQDSAAAPTRSAFPDIPGIDRQRAQQLLDQDWSFFLRLAHRFAADFADATQQTRQDLARGELLAAQRRLHTLRGLAGNLGALELAHGAQLLETALNDPRADPAPALATFDTRLRALLSALAPWLRDAPSVPDADTDAPLDAARLSALCKALSEHDLVALDLFDALQPALTRRDGQAATQALAQLIQSLRFREALARLTRTEQAAP